MCKAPASIAVPATSRREAVVGSASTEKIDPELNTADPELIISIELPGLSVAPLCTATAPTVPIPFNTAPDCTVIGEGPFKPLTTSVPAETVVASVYVFVLLGLAYRFPI